MGPLRRLGRGVDGREVHILAVKLAGFVSPQRLHRQHRLPGVGGPLGEFNAEQLRFLPQPAGADAEQEAPAAEVVQGGDFLGQQDGVALRHQADARTQFERAGDRRGPPQRHKGVHAFVVHLRDDPVRRARPGRLGAGGDGRVFRHPQRLEAVPLASLRQLGNVNGGLGNEHCDANFHIVPSRDGHWSLLTFGKPSTPSFHRHSESFRSSSFRHLQPPSTVIPAQAGIYACPQFRYRPMLFVDSGASGMPQLLGAVSASTSRGKFGS